MKKVNLPSLSRSIFARSAFRHVFSLLPALALAMAGIAQASTSTWSGASTTDWSTAGSWTGTDTPPVAADTALFNSGSGTSITVANAVANQAITNVSFDTAAGNFTIGATGANQLQFQSGGTTQILSTLTATNATETINAPIVLEGAAGTYTFANNSANGTGAGAGTLNFGGGITGGAAGATALTLSGSNTNANTISGIIGNGSATTLGITKSGAGTWVLSGVNTYTGTTAVNGGTLKLTNYSTDGALALGGGTLNLSESAGGTQTYTGATYNAGPDTISASSSSGTPTLALGSQTYATGATVEYVGPATIGASNVAVGATGTITTTTVGGGTSGLVVSGGTAYATVGLYDYASTSLAGAGGAGTSPYTIIGGSQVTGFYTTLAGGGTVGASNTIYDVTGATASSSGSSTFNGDTFRFNTATATTFTVSTSKNFGIAGILVTPNVGAHNVTFGGNGTGLGLGNNQSNPMTIFQNDTSGELIFNSGSVMIRGTGTYVQSGPGTVLEESAAGNLYTGSNYLNGGVTEITGTTAAIQDSQLGGTAASNVNINGGTLVAGFTGNLDNGTTAHPIVLGNNGGGLGAVNGVKLTVDGLISGAAGTGPLVIGIPASSANGSTVGQLPGTGSGTANSSVLANGTVVLTGANTYTGGTVIDSGTLQFAGTGSSVNLNAFGTGPITLNGGTFQWGSGNTTDISALTVALAGGGTFDTFGNAVTLGSAIGNGGSGGVTVADTGSTHGSLTFSNASGNNYSGTTTVNANGKLIITNTSGSATGSSNVSVGSTGTFAGTGISTGLVTVASGGTITPGVSQQASGTLTVGQLTFNVGSAEAVYVGSSNAAGLITVSASGGLTINGGTIDVFNASTGTPSNIVGVYDLINYSGLLGGSGFSTMVTNTQAVAPSGFTYTLSSTGSAIDLTIALASTPNVWNAPGLNGGDWNTQSNWTTGTASTGPNAAGANVVFGNGVTNTPQVGGTVNISASAIAGTLQFTNANAYTLTASSGQSLTLDNSGSNSSINLTLGNHTITAPVIVNSPGVTVNTGSGETLTWSGNISGTGTMTINGPGTTLLSGTNTYGPAAATIGTTFNSGLLQVGSSSALSTGDVSVTASNTLQAAAAGLSLGNNFIIANGTTTTIDTNGNTLTLSGKVTDTTGGGGGSGAFTVASTTSGGTLILTGSSNDSGGTITINSGATLQVGNGAGGSLSSTPNITDNGALVNAVGTGVTVTPGTISGTGTLTQSGAGTLSLTNVDSSFTGATTVTAGTLVVGSFGALESSQVNYNGGTIIFTGPTSATFGSLVGSANLSLNETSSSLGEALTTGGDNTSTVYSGNLTGLGSLTKAGTGTMTLTGANTYSGNTTISGGLLAVTGGTLGSSTSTLSVAYGGTGFGQTGGTVTGQNFWVSNGVSNASAYIAGNSSGSVAGTGSDTFTNTVLGSGSNTGASIIINTSGTVALGGITLNRDSTNASGASTNTGLRIIGGTVTANGINVVGNGGHGANLNLTGGSLTLASTNVFNVSTATNSGGAGGGFLTVSGGSLTYTGANGLLLDTTSTSGVGLVNLTGGTTTLNAITLNSGNSAAATSSVTLSGTGILYLGAAGFTGTPGSTVSSGAGIVEGTGGTLSVNLNGGTLGASGNWATSAPITLDSTGSATPTIQAADVGGTAYNITFSGAVGGTGGFAKTGGGTLTLSGANTYTGVTAVNTGTVSINTVAAGATAQSLGEDTASNAVTLGVAGTSSGTLSYTGTGGTLDKNIAVLGNGGDTIQNSGTGLLTLTGGITKNGTTLTLNGGSSGINVSGVISGSLANSDLDITGGATTISTAATYSGPTWIYGNGVLVNGVSGGALPTSTTLNLGTAGSGGVSVGGAASAGTFDLGGNNQTVAGLNTVGTGSYTSDVVTNNSSSQNAVLTVSGGGTFAGVIQDGVNGHNTGLTSTGGTMVLSGANTYTGPTSVTGGTFLVNGSNTGGGTVAVAAAGSANAVLGGTGSITGNVTVGNGGGTGTSLLYPGASGAISHLTLNSSVTLGTNSGLEFNINTSGIHGNDGGNPTVYGTGTNSFADLLTIAGTLTLGSNLGTLTLNDINASTGIAEGDIIVLATTSGITGTLNGYANGSSFIYGANEYTINYGTLSGYSNDLTVTVVPEPSTWAMMFSGLALLVFIQIRRRHQNC